MELDVEVIRDLGHAYPPHVYDGISLSASLEGHHVQSLQSLPVAEVLEATQLPLLSGPCSFLFLVSSGSFFISSSCRS
jgi:hypothetical protein